jgi:U3 small nucleolar ribonucleoprotein component
MNILDQRDEIHDDILKRRFIQKVFREASKDIDKAQTTLMDSRGFEEAEWYTGRSFIINDNELEYTHLKKHRFVDMKTRKTKDGIKRKKSHPVHNKIIWGHYNDIIKQLHFGFVQSVKEELSKIQD